jgi:hypothetical protein
VIPLDARRVERNLPSERRRLASEAEKHEENDSSRHPPAPIPAGQGRADRAGLVVRGTQRGERSHRGVHFPPASPPHFQRERPPRKSMIYKGFRVLENWLVEASTSQQSEVS